MMPHTRKRRKMREKVVRQGSAAIQGETSPYNGVYPPTVWNSRYAFKTMINSVTAQTRILSQGGFTNRPILALSPVNCTSGMTVKPSCSDRIIWLRMSSSPVPRWVRMLPVPPIALTMKHRTVRQVIALSCVAFGHGPAGQPGPTRRWGSRLPRDGQPMPQTTCLAR
jgi:hypothetical protein